MWRIFQVVQIIAWVPMILAEIWMIHRSWRRKHTDARLFAVGFAFLVGAMVIDTFKSHGWINAPFLVTFLAAAFIWLIAWMLARRVEEACSSPNVPTRACVVACSFERSRCNAAWQR